MDKLEVGKTYHMRYLSSDLQLAELWSCDVKVLNVEEAPNIKGVPTLYAEVLVLEDSVEQVQSIFPRYDAGCRYHKGERVWKEIRQQQFTPIEDRSAS